MSRQKEVQDIMITLFSQEKISEIHDYNLAMQACAEGRAEGMAESKMEIAKTCFPSISHMTRSLWQLV